MKTCSAITMALLAVCSAATADIGSPRLQQAQVNARALALGGNYTALAQDYSALYYNPAALAFVKAREAQVGLSGLINASATDAGSGSTVVDKERIRLSAGGLLWSVPASRGGLSFALGYSCPGIFDNATQYARETANTTDEFRLTSYGQLNLWSVGFGVQFAPGLSGGLTASLVTGSSTSQARRYFEQFGAVVDSVNDNYETTIDRTYVGYDLRFGIMYQFNDMLAMGLRVVAPRHARFSSTVEERYPLLPIDSMQSYEDPGSLSTTWEGALGVSLKLPWLVLSPEASFRAPNPRDTTTTDAAYWKIGAGIGAEVPLGKSGLLVRLGYRFDEYDDKPYSVEYDYDEVAVEQEPVKEVTRDQHAFSGGLAYVTRGALCFELGYSYRMWAYSYGALDQAFASHQVMLSVALRY